MLNPETIKVLDPACGSGHILVEAYDILKGIYEEQGYEPKAIPRLILEKNLYGLDIDDRAAQLAAFALMMKARADDRRIFANPPKLNILSLQSTEKLNLAQLWHKLDLYKEGKIGATSSLFEEPQLNLTDEINRQEYKMLAEILPLFVEAKTFGSLIQVPASYEKPLADLLAQLENLVIHGDTFQTNAAKTLISYIRQAHILAMKFDAVVANPPYMGSNYMVPELRDLGYMMYPDGKSDLFSMFVIRLMDSVIDGGYISLMTPFTWMNLSSYKMLRAKILKNFSLQSLIQPEYHSFFESAYVPICTFSLQKISQPCTAIFIDLSSFYGEEKQAYNALLAIENKNCTWRFERNTADFLKVPGNIIAYSFGNKALKCFDAFPPLAEIADLKQGLITGDNEKFLRFWQEVDIKNSSLNKNKKNVTWYPYQKGGALRKWYGNNEYFVNWESDGLQIRNFFNAKGKLRSRPQNIQYFFREGLTWTSLTISALSMRYVENGFIFDAKGPMCFPKNSCDLYEIIG